MFSLDDARLYINTEQDYLLFKRLVIKNAQKVLSVIGK